MKPDLASVIKVGAVLTAAPRWVGALLAAEGFLLPSAWLVWWIPVSAVLSACMALVEGLAFAYIFERWRNQTDSNSPRLFWLSMVSAVIFVIILAPYIAAQVSGVPLREGLTGAWLYAWSVAVGASTISIVAGVGYAQKRRVARMVAKNETRGQPEMQPVAQLEETSTKQRVLMLRESNPDATQAEIAEIVGVSRQMVGKYLNGNGKVKHE